MRAGHQQHDGIATRSGAGRRPRRWPTVVLALTLLGAAATACGDDSGEEDAGGASGDVVTGDVDFEPTTGYLAAASRRSSDEPYRLETSMAMNAEGEGQDLSVDATLMTGEQDGSTYEYHMDMEHYLDQLPSAAAAGFPASADLTQDMVSDGRTLYIRAPLYAALAEQAGRAADLGPLGELAELGDDWGRVDLEALGGLSLTDVQGSAGAPGGADPRALLDLVANAEDVEELGTDEVDDEPVNGLGAPLSMGELMEAQGVDPEKFVDQLAANLGGLEQVDPEELGPSMDAVMLTEIPFEVWVDGNGYVRRVSFEYDMVELMSGLGSGRASRGIDTFTIGSTLDYSDYGDDSIEIEVPPSDATDARDVTDVYRRMLEAGRGG